MALPTRLGAGTSNRAYRAAILHLSQNEPRPCLSAEMLESVGHCWAPAPDKVELARRSELYMDADKNVAEVRKSASTLRKDRTTGPYSGLLGDEPPYTHVPTLMRS